MSLVLKLYHHFSDFENYCTNSIGKDLDAFDEKQGTNKLSKFQHIGLGSST